MNQEVNCIWYMKKNMSAICNQMDAMAKNEDLTPSEKKEWADLKEKVSNLNHMIDEKLRIKLDLLDDVYKKFCNAPINLRATIMNELLALKIFRKEQFNEVFKDDLSMYLFAMMIEHGVKEETLDLSQNWFAYDVERVELFSAGAPEFFLKDWKEFATALIRNTEVMMKLGYSEKECRNVQRAFMK